MNKKTIGLLAVMTGNIIFGFSFLFSRIALEFTSPTVLIATRFLIAFLLLNLIVLLGRKLHKADGSPLIENAGNYGQLVETVFAVPSFWISIAYLAVISSVIAFLLLNFGSNHVSVSQATIMGSLTTVISIAAGVLILKEAFTLPQFVGALFILISVYLGR